MRFYRLGNEIINVRKMIQAKKLNAGNICCIQVFCVEENNIIITFETEEQRDKEFEKFSNKLIIEE